jgi:hypothetical protein
LINLAQTQHELLLASTYFAFIYLPRLSPP